MGSVAEQTLPSLLRSLFLWFEKQMLLDEGGVRQRHKSKGYVYKQSNESTSLLAPPFSDMST